MKKKSKSIFCRKNTIQKFINMAFNTLFSSEYSDCISHKCATGRAWSPEVCQRGTRFGEGFGILDKSQ